MLRRLLVIVTIAAATLLAGGCGPEEDPDLSRFAAPTSEPGTRGF